MANSEKLVTCVDFDPMWEESDTAREDFALSLGN